MTISAIHNLPYGPNVQPLSNVSVSKTHVWPAPLPGASGFALPLPASDGACAATFPHDSDSDARNTATTTNAHLIHAHTKPVRGAIASDQLGLGSFAERNCFSPLPITSLS
jgi:hypothetical protein